MLKLVGGEKYGETQGSTPQVISSKMLPHYKLRWLYSGEIAPWPGGEVSRDITNPVTCCTKDTSFSVLLPKTHHLIPRMRKRPTQLRCSLQNNWSIPFNITKVTRDKEGWGSVTVSHQREMMIKCNVEGTLKEYKGSQHDLSTVCS